MSEANTEGKPFLEKLKPYYVYIAGGTAVLGIISTIAIVSKKRSKKTDTAAPPTSHVGEKSTDSSVNSMGKSPPAATTTTTAFAEPSSIGHSPTDEPKPTDRSELSQPKADPSSEEIVTSPFLKQQRDSAGHKSPTEEDQSDLSAKVNQLSSPGRFDAPSKLVNRQPEDVQVLGLSFPLPKNFTVDRNPQFPTRFPLAKKSCRCSEDDAVMIYITAEDLTPSMRHVDSEQFKELCVKGLSREVAQVKILHDGPAANIVSRDVIFDHYVDCVLNFDESEEAATPFVVSFMTVAVHNIGYMLQFRAPSGKYEMYLSSFLDSAEQSMIDYNATDVSPLQGHLRHMVCIPLAGEENMITACLISPTTYHCLPSSSQPHREGGKLVELQSILFGDIVTLSTQQPSSSTVQDGESAPHVTNCPLCDQTNAFLILPAGAERDNFHVHLVSSTKDKEDTTTLYCNNIFQFPLPSQLASHFTAMVREHLFGDSLLSLFIRYADEKLSSSGSHLPYSCGPLSSIGVKSTVTAEMQCGFLPLSISSCRSILEAQCEENTRMKRQYNDKVLGVATPSIILEISGNSIVLGPAYHVRLIAVQLQGDETKSAPQCLLFRWIIPMSLLSSLSTYVETFLYQFKFHQG